MTDQTPAAFISYCRVDQEFALRLAQDLKAAGAAVWLDQLDLRPGKPWDNAVEDALRTATKMLVILTPVSVASENVRDEIAYALKQGKIVIPVLYMECEIPLRLERKQHIDFRADYARGLELLLHELRVENPDQAVLERAAEADAKRQLAWQAREAEAKRLLEDGQQHDEATNPPEKESPGGNKVGFFQPWLWGGVGWTGLVSSVAAVLIVGFVFSQHSPPSNNDVASQPPTVAVQSTVQPPISQSTPDAESKLSAVATSGTHDTAPLTASAPSTTRPSKSENAQPASVLMPPEHVVASKPDLTALAKQGVALSKSHRDAEAIPLLSQACDGEISEACLELGDIYNFDEGEIKQAYPLYSRACERKLPLGCRRLGVLYQEDEDYVNALAALKTGCDGGDFHACLGAGGIYEDGPQGVGKSTFRARQLYEKACNLGASEGCELSRKMPID